MNQNEVITAIKEVAKSDKVADAVFHMWAVRERARGQVTVEGLDQRMRGEGFKFDKAEYGKLLKRMADLGFGRLDTTERGRVRALKDVRVRLQSIGKAAIGEEVTLTGWRARNKFKHLPAMVEAKPPKAAVTLKASDAKEGGAYIAVALGGRMVSIPLPGNLSDMEIGILVRRLQND